MDEDGIRKARRIGVSEQGAPPVVVVVVGRYNIW